MASRPVLDGPWNGQLRLEPAGWVLVVEGRPLCTCNGRPIDGSVVLYEGDRDRGRRSLESDSTSFRNPAFTAPRMSTPSARCSASSGDDLLRRSRAPRARRSLAGRLRRGARRVRAPASARASLRARRSRQTGNAGLRPARGGGVLRRGARARARGFVQTALVVEDGEPLDGFVPDGLHLSPRQYCVVRYIREEEHMRCSRRRRARAAGGRRALRW